MRRLREWRIARHMTLRALAEAADITLKTLTDLEFGRRLPRHKTMQRISRALDVPPDEITEFVAAMEHYAALPDHPRPPPG